MRLHAVLPAPCTCLIPHPAPPFCSNENCCCAQPDATIPPERIGPWCCVVGVRSPFLRCGLLCCTWVARSPPKKPPAQLQGVVPLPPQPHTHTELPDLCSPTAHDIAHRAPDRSRQRKYTTLLAECCTVCVCLPSGTNRTRPTRRTRTLVTSTLR